MEREGGSYFVRCQSNSLALSITSLGAVRQRIFLDDESRETFLATLAWVVGRFDGAAGLSSEGAGKYSRGPSINMFVKYYESAWSMCAVEADPPIPPRGE